jgi:hypothetical protein
MDKNNILERLKDFEDFDFPKDEQEEFEPYEEFEETFSVLEVSKILLGDWTPIKEKKDILIQECLVDAKEILNQKYSNDQVQKLITDNLLMLGDLLRSDFDAFQSAFQRLNIQVISILKKNGDFEKHFSEYLRDVIEPYVTFLDSSQIYMALNRSVENSVAHSFDFENGLLTIKSTDSLLVHSNCDLLISDVIMDSNKCKDEFPEYFYAPELKGRVVIRSNRKIWDCTSIVSKACFSERVFPMAMTGNVDTIIQDTFETTKASLILFEYQNVFENDENTFYGLKHLIAFEPILKPTVVNVYQVQFKGKGKIFY